MKPRYSFSSKKTKNATKSKKMRKQRKKYPDILKKIILEADIIVEVLDARFPQQTRNFKIEEVIQQNRKSLIFALNKSDIADLGKFKKSELKNLKPSIFVSATKRRGIKKLRDQIKIEAAKTKKPSDEKVIVGIIGYPNTGKSSIINSLIGRSAAPVGSDAGFTKGLQKLKMTNEIQIMDTPGVIPEKEYSMDDKEKIARHTMVGGRSHSQVKDPEMIVFNMMQNYGKQIEKHYKINAKGDTEKLLEELGRKKGLLKKGDEVNIDKTARLILKDWQEGKIRV